RPQRAGARLARAASRCQEACGAVAVLRVHADLRLERAGGRTWTRFWSRDVACWRDTGGACAVADAGHACGTGTADVRRRQHRWYGFHPADRKRTAALGFAASGGRPEPDERVPHA